MPNEADDLLYGSDFYTYSDSGSDSGSGSDPEPEVETDSDGLSDSIDEQAYEGNRLATLLIKLIPELSSDDVFYGVVFPDEELLAVPFIKSWAALGRAVEAMDEQELGQFEALLEAAFEDHSSILRDDSATLLVIAIVEAVFNAMQRGGITPDVLKEDDGVSNCLIVATCSMDDYVDDSRVRCAVNCFVDRYVDPVNDFFNVFDGVDVGGEVWRVITLTRHARFTLMAKHLAAHLAALDVGSDLARIKINQIYDAAGLILARSVSAMERNLCEPSCAHLQQDEFDLSHIAEFSEFLKRRLTKADDQLDQHERTLVKCFYHCAAWLIEINKRLPAKLTYQLRDFPFHFARLLVFNDRNQSSFQISQRLLSRLAGHFHEVREKLAALSSAFFSVTEINAFDSSVRAPLLKFLVTIHLMTPGGIDLDELKAFICDYAILPSYLTRPSSFYPLVSETKTAAEAWRNAVRLVSRARMVIKVGDNLRSARVTQRQQYGVGMSLLAMWTVDIRRTLIIDSDVLFSEKLHLCQCWPGVDRVASLSKAEVLNMNRFIRLFGEGVLAATVSSLVEERWPDKVCNLFNLMSSKLTLKEIHELKELCQVRYGERWWFYFSSAIFSGNFDMLLEDKLSDKVYRLFDLMLSKINIKNTHELKALFQARYGERSWSYFSSVLLSGNFGMLRFLGAIDASRQSAFFDVIDCLSGGVSESSLKHAAGILDQDIDLFNGLISCYQASPALVKLFIWVNTQCSRGACSWFEALEECAFFAKDFLRFLATDYDAPLVDGRIEVNRVAAFIDLFSRGLHEQIAQTLLNNDELLRKVMALPVDQINSLERALAMLRGTILESRVLKAVADNDQAFLVSAQGGSGEAVALCVRCAVGREVRLIPNIAQMEFLRSFQGLLDKVNGIIRPVRFECFMSSMFKNVLSDFDVGMNLFDSVQESAPVVLSEAELCQKMLVSLLVLLRSTFYRSGLQDDDTFYLDFEARLRQCFRGELANYFPFLDGQEGEFMDEVMQQAGVASPRPENVRVASYQCVAKALNASCRASVDARTPAGVELAGWNEVARLRASRAALVSSHTSAGVSVSGEVDEELPHEGPAIELAKLG